MLRINNVKLSLDEDKSELRNKIETKLEITTNSLSIYKESIDARKEVVFVYTVDFECEDEDEVLEKHSNLLIKVAKYEVEPTEKIKNYKGPRPIVVGFGPSGIFASLELARAGLNPIVFERGGNVDERLNSVKEFWENGKLDTNSNVQFGEGGAGTFSDGKLTARTKGNVGKKILKTLVEFGAPEEIVYEAHPHVGTDLLSGIIKNIRAEIIKLGGEVNFNAKVSEFIIEENEIKGVVVNDEKFLTDRVILAIGHSARDTFNVIYDKKIECEFKEFAVGFRVEHKQELIDKNQYKQHYKNKRLGHASYRLTHKASTGLGVYSFCMCPGGIVVPSTSHTGCVVTNGMSYHSRALENANSGVLVQVKKEDFEDLNPMSGIKFQEQLEKSAYAASDSYRAPFQSIRDYVYSDGYLSKVKPSYSLGVARYDMNKLFNSKMNASLKEGLINFNRKIPGFIDGIMTGVESRSSSPIRIVRNKERESLSVKGLYPVGEGSGYSGGIITSAIDGMKASEEILRKLINK
jgi:uncharacterized FAD-dependent dehydrogenase